MKKQPTFARTLLTSLLALNGACVISPYSGQTVDRNAPVRFEIYATSPNASIRLECRHHYSSVLWSTTITGGSNPITYGGDTLYPKTVNITIPSTCWETWGSQYITYIRPFQGSYNMAVFDEAGQDCVFDQVFGEQVSPISAGLDCRKQGNDILLLSN